jgi:hypothetical protein
MQSIVLEFDTEAEMEDALRHVWEKLAVSGEAVAQQLPEGGFRLEIVSEKPIKANTLDKLGGRQVKD